MSAFDVQHRDCYESLAAMRDAGGCDLILTSPPYPDARKPEAYGATFDTTMAGYGKLGDATFEGLKPGGVCALNIDGPVRVWRESTREPQRDVRVDRWIPDSSERSLLAFKVAVDWAERVGFRYIERCVYAKYGLPGDHGPRWRMGGELVHVFARPGSRTFFDAHACKRPSKTPGQSSKGGMVRSTASGGAKKRGFDHTGGFTTGETSVLTTVMDCPTQGKIDTNHEAPFSRDLADAYVLCYSPPGGLVGDPFVGSGTVAFSCHRHGRRFIGGDLGVRKMTTVGGRKVACGRRWADIVNEGLAQTRLFA